MLELRISCFLQRLKLRIRHPLKRLNLRLNALWLFEKSWLNFIRLRESRRCALHRLVMSKGQTQLFWIWGKMLLRCLFLLIVVLRLFHRCNSLFNECFGPLKSHWLGLFDLIGFFFFFSALWRTTLFPAFSFWLELLCCQFLNCLLTPFNWILVDYFVLWHWEKLMCRTWDRISFSSVFILLFLV